MNKIEERMRGMGLTSSTIKTYSVILNNFFEYYKKVNNFTVEEVNNYLDYLIVVKNYKARSRNLIAKIIKFYFREFLGISIDIRMSKEDKPLPKMCEDVDFSKILSVTPNPKHRLCLLMMRYSGLRRWEVIRVMRHHILNDGRLLVHCGKGQKSRYTLIPIQVMDLLQPYLELLPVGNPYIFQGMRGGYYNKRTPQAILNNAFIKLGWGKEKWFGCHALRHSFTIWALDNKIGDYDEVSKWLGHSVRQTTQIYTQCRKINIQEAVKRCAQMVIVQ